MKNPIEFQSAEKEFSVDVSLLSEMKMQERLFRSPMDFFKSVRNGYLRKTGDLIQADRQFMDTLPLLIGCLKENFFNFSYVMPEIVAQVLSGTDDDVQTTVAMITILKNLGIAKEVVRSWVIQDFAQDTPQVELQTKFELTVQQLTQLRFIEKIYEQN